MISAGIPGAGHDGPGQDIAEALVHHERAAAVFPEITFRTIVPSKIAPAKRGRGPFRRGNPWKKDHLTDAKSPKFWGCPS